MTPSEQVGDRALADVLPERLDHKDIFREIIGERCEPRVAAREDHESSCRQYALSSMRIPGTALVNALHERAESPKPGPLSMLVALPPRNSDDSFSSPARRGTQLCGSATAVIGWSTTLRGRSSWATAPRCRITSSSSRPSRLAIFGIN